LSEYNPSLHCLCVALQLNLSLLKDLLPFQQKDLGVKNIRRQRAQKTKESTYFTNDFPFLGDLPRVLEDLPLPFDVYVHQHLEVSLHHGHKVKHLILSLLPLHSAENRIKLGLLKLKLLRADLSENTILLGLVIERKKEILKKERRKEVEKKKGRGKKERRRRRRRKREN